MSRVLDKLKRPLLPAWNGGHRIARRAGMVVGALARGRVEHCHVCGRHAPILYRRGVIPERLERIWGLSPRLAEAFARKESSHCAWCGANLRTRRIARVLLETYPVGTPPTPVASIAEWVGPPEVRALRLAEINGIDGLHSRLLGLPGLAYSEFVPGVEPGTLVEGVRCEDLTRLSYPDASFDLILTSETLEHVPDLDAALREVDRVLVPGGRHVFTVPWLPDVASTYARTVVAPDGSLVHRAPPIYHPGGDVGYPVFTEFGVDLPEILRRSGLEVSVAYGPPTADDLAQVFICRKPSGRGTA